MLITLCEWGFLAAQLLYSCLMGKHIAPENTDSTCVNGSNRMSESVKGVYLLLGLCVTNCLFFFALKKKITNVINMRTSIFHNRFFRPECRDLNSVYKGKKMYASTEKYAFLENNTLCSVSYYTFRRNRKRVRER